MPMSVGVRLNENISKFHFLCMVPILEDTPLLPQDDCAICKEPYRDNRWELGGTLQQPVELPCRHLFGFQCLARWVLSANFHNHCPFCGVQMINFSHTRTLDKRPLNFSLARVEMVTVLARNGLSPKQKSQLLVILEDSLRREMTFAHNKPNMPIDKPMVVWEEFLNTICKVSAETAGPRAPTRATPAVLPAALRPAPAGPNHGGVNARAVARPRAPSRGDETGLILSKTRTQITLFSSAALLACSSFAAIQSFTVAINRSPAEWGRDDDHLRLDDLGGIFGSVLIWLLSLVVFCTLVDSKVHLKGTLLFLGVLVGTVSAMLVR